jgi:hypothetical protein
MKKGWLCENLCQLPPNILHIFDPLAVDPAHLIPEFSGEAVEMFARA